MKGLSKAMQAMKEALMLENIKSPIMASVDMTKDCNLHCVHCYNRSQDRRNNFNSYDSVVLLADRLLELNIMEITICGGEPLCSNFFLEFVKLLKKHKRAIRIITNGILLDSCEDDLIELLDDDILQISIDEPLREMNYQRYIVEHPKQIKARVYKNLRSITEKYPNVIVNITPTKLNQYDIKEIINDVIEHGAKYIGATPYIPIGGSKADNIKPDYNYLRMVERDVIRYYGDKIVYLGGISGHACQKVSDVEPSVSYEQQYRFCDAGNFSFHVACDGNIFPCAFFQENQFKISHIEKDAKVILCDFKNFNRLENCTLPELCQKCSILSKCYGGCMGLIYDRYKNLDSVDPRCIYC